MDVVQTQASAKIILFGEHAVVYQQPAIAVPVFALQAHADMQASDKPFHIIATDLGNRLMGLAQDQPLMQMALSTFHALQIEAPDASLRLSSTIPMASGLGSGAAVSTAIGRAIAAYSNCDLSAEMLNQLVYQIEQIHHGTPSGIDNTVIVYEQAIYYVRNQPLKMIENASDLTLLIADTGQAALTKVAVGDVRKLVETQPEQTMPVIEAIGQLTEAAQSAMQAGQPEALGQLMVANHEQLQRLTVSSPQLDRLVAAAISAGALGAKLSGGGRGGNMIALVDDKAEQVREALLTAGAVRVIQTTIPRTTQQ